MMKKQNSEITCPYKSANVNRSPQQLQSFSTPPIRQIVKHGLVLRPEIQRCGSERSAHHARQTELNLPGCRSGDATECECALADLTPGGKIALGAGSFALEILDGGECRLAQVRDLHRVSRLDDLVQDRLDIGGLPGRLAPEHRQQRGI